VTASPDAGPSVGRVASAGPATSHPPSPIAQLLQGWLPGQRWFAGKGGGGSVTMRRVGGVRLQDPAGEVGIEIHLVGVVEDVGADDGSDAGSDVDDVVYQVPLTYRGAPEPALEHALVGTFSHAELGPRWVYDGPHDPVFVTAWLQLIADGAQASADQGPGFGTARGVRPDGGRALNPLAPSTVLRGEQSNTSVIVDAAGPNPAMLKVFRAVAAGDNPDVVVASALARVGCARVPAPVGWIEGSWPAPFGGPDGDAEPRRGQLAFVAEFLAGSEDAWRVACRAVDAGESFAGPARELGAATAQVHEALVAALPTVPTTAERLAELADGLLERVDWAVREAPVLADHAAAARAAVGAVRAIGQAAGQATGQATGQAVGQAAGQEAGSATPLLLQQVHGDLHLGQVLHSPTRGWVLLDFEGEPLRPLAERMEPDLALRDVAGMLRSFDYAARNATVTRADDDPRVAAADAWAQECREAFLDGYASVAGRDPRVDGALLRALELDKALYEVVYETRNRPGWVPVPLHAVRRLLPLG
jgi:trehalose synthase-fused probable maltokinase